MVEKIVHIRDVGPFAALSSSGDTTFRKLTLIFGSNGSGKSTLTSVLRAASRRTRLSERQRLGATTTPSVHLMVPGGALKKANGVWTGPSVRVEAFDRAFIDGNVHVGGDIYPEQRQNLLQLALGESQVAAAREVERLTNEIARITSERAQLSKQLEVVAGSFGVPIAEYLQLPPTQDATKLLEDIEQERRNLQIQQPIRERSAFSYLPVLDSSAFRGVSSLLERSAEVLAVETETRVREHINGRLGGGRAEAWVEQGIQYHKGGTDCPFCGQDLTPSDLVSAYAKYFDKTYQDFLNQLRSARAAVEQQQRKWDEVSLTDSSNSQMADFWAAATSGSKYTTDLASLAQEWKLAHESVLQLIERKVMDPNTPIKATSELDAAESGIKTVNERIQLENNRIEALNAAVSRVKNSVAAGSIPDLDLRRNRILAAVDRHTAPREQLVADIQTRDESKTKAEEEKQRARSLLNQAQASRLQSFEGEVNRVLGLLGAGFTVQSLRAVVPAGRPSAEYVLVLGTERISAASKSADSPTFKTVLSEGDKTTLALALFFATLKDDPELDQKVVVFDDPMSSLDEDRASATRELLRALLPQAKQVIVMSHLPRFLLDLAQRLPSGEVKSLRIEHGSNHIQECDLRVVCQSEYDRQMRELRAYASTGTPTPNVLEMRASIRNVLEEYLRNRFPHLWNENEWLGDFVAKASARADLKACINVTELDALKTYSSPSHHATNSLSYTPTTPNELRTYARRAYEFIAASLA